MSKLYKTCILQYFSIIGRAGSKRHDLLGATRSANYRQITDILRELSSIIVLSFTYEALFNFFSV